ncbi:MAG TPA: hypothetical protein VMI56_21005 [Reyranella sp.]|nr:hypothetical protein [Reyranella sp.]
MLRFITLAIAGLCLSGCAASLSKSTANQAASLDSLTKQQIFYNLAHVADVGYVPTQVQITLGTAQTAFAVSPTLTVPFGGNITNTLAPGSSSGAFSSQTAYTAPGLSLGASGTWTQSWNMTPPADAETYARLRALYLYVLDESSERTAQESLLCNYPVQRQPVVIGSESKTVNIPYLVPCVSDGRRTALADPTFLTDAYCVACLSLGQQLELDLKKTIRSPPTAAVSHKLRGFHIYKKESGGAAPAGTEAIGTYESWTFYTKEKDRLTDFILFTFAAMAQPNSTLAGTAGSPGVPGDRFIKVGPQ